MKAQALTLARTARSTVKGILTWNWTKRLLYWIVLSAGTMAECVFLVASLWVTVNASVHAFVLVFLSEEMTVHLTQLATVAYVGLPECILALAIVTTLSHIRTWLYNKADKRALTWSILYGLPTVIFLVLSLITIGCSLLSVDFKLPPFMIVTRGLAGYSYGLIALLYSQLGVPQERDRLQQKDDSLAAMARENAVNLEALRRENAINFAATARENAVNLANLRRENAINLEALRREKELLLEKVERQNREIEESKNLLAESINAQARLANAMHKSNEPASQAYSEDLQKWLAEGHKTISVEDIVRLTGHHKRKVSNAIANNILLTSSRNRTLVLAASFVTWLNNNPPSVGKTTEEIPILHIVND